ncbi:WGxxGxxG family protein [Mycobacterium asiaticum]|uniref:Gram-positive cocci surface proteins LPxTG domain-containing protein n=1 Tax=Mycobacterium asiaticum TaxID=1790 RepID=A0A1A3MWM3_MYCAS|nr:WGxxGxxG family protein [Mycobacterium asiaticum]OBK13480.1 hypothetical protein A5636_09360 [Mycobacterium asiaticum]
MRTAIATLCAAAAVTFGGAGIANATVDHAPVPSSTTTTVAEPDNANNNKESDKTGLWGLLGLAGLAGLAGLKRRRDDNVVVDPAAGRRPTA